MATNTRGRSEVKREEIINLLVESPGLNVSQIKKELGYPMKTVSYYIHQLSDDGLIKLVPNLMDMRKKSYKVIPS